MSDVLHFFKQSIPTTGVGSLPVDNPNQDIRDQTRAAISMQLDAGITVVTTGQVSMYGKDMIAPFLQTVAGLTIANVLGEDVPMIETRKKLRALPAGELAKCEVVKEIEFAREAIDEYKDKLNYTPFLKASITGPSTILNEIPSIGLGGYSSKEDILSDLCKVILAVAQAMIKAGADCIQIDEPIFSRGEFDSDVQKEVKALELVTTSIKPSGGLGVHVCGELNQDLFEELTRLKGVDVLDFEFHLYNSNFKTVDPKTLDIAERYGTPKLISVGVISSTDEYVETCEATKNLMKKAIRRYGPHRVCFDADCGLRSFKPSVAKSKLEVLGQAAHEIRLELGLDA